MRTNAPDRRRPLPTGWGIPGGVAAGAAIGLLFGILLEQLAAGLIIGAAIGLLVGASATALTATPADRRGTVAAVAIALLTAGLALVLFIALR
jgi:predicted lipid-binding transport protein (Tim44 family)